MQHNVCICQSFAKLACAVKLYFCPLNVTFKKYCEKKILWMLVPFPFANNIYILVILYIVRLLKYLMDILVLIFQPERMIFSNTHQQKELIADKLKCGPLKCGKSFEIIPCMRDFKILIKWCLLRDIFIITCKSCLFLQYFFMQVNKRYWIIFSSYYICISFEFLWMHITFTNRKIKLVCYKSSMRKKFRF